MIRCVFCGAGVVPATAADGTAAAWGCMACGSRMTGGGKDTGTGEEFVGYLEKRPGLEPRRVWVPLGKTMVRGEEPG
jgi:hypothetical protein